MEDLEFRQAFLIKPTKKFRAWFDHLGDIDPDFPDPEIDPQNPTTYLITPRGLDTPEEGREELSIYWQGIAYHEFGSWWTDEENWPDLTTIEDFECYFDWTFIPEVVDLGYELEDDEEI